MMIFVCFSSCEKPGGCGENWSNKIEKTTIVDAFNHIEFPSYLEVYWVKSNDFKIHHSGNPKLLEELTTQYKSDTLVFDYVPKCEWLRNHRNRIQLTVHSPTLSSVIIRGSSTFETLDTLTNEFKFGAYDNFENHRLLINNNRTYIQLHAAAPTVEAFGKTDSALFYSVGSSRLKAQFLQTDWTFLDHFANAPSQIHVNGTLEISQKGSGEVCVWGDPQNVVILSNEGSGNLEIK